jgi:hypothetical protein
MKHRSIRWLGCIGLGLTLGSIAGYQNLIPLSRADWSTPATAQPNVAGSAGLCENNGEPSKCCSPPHAFPEPTKAPAPAVAVEPLEEEESLSPTEN